MAGLLFADLHLVMCFYFILLYYKASVSAVSCMPWHLSQYSLYRSIVLPSFVFWVPVKYLNNNNNNNNNIYASRSSFNPYKHV